jgi:hypothetical protein
MQAQGDQQTADSAIAIFKRMDHLELGMNDGCN